MYPDHTDAIPSHWKRRTIFSAVAAALAPGWTHNSYAQEQGSTDSNRLEEIIVTARKRSENIQDIPQSIQAFSAVDIARTGIKSLQDVAKFVPSMTVVGSSAGQNKIVFRGLADSVHPYLASSSAAVYLDDQPLTTNAQSPEIRPIDMERIESLAGPQGTLYGASSESGTVRYIVNKPDPHQFAANVGGGVHTISHGSTGWDTDAMVNIPLIQDKLAIRLVGFAAKDAGYIDNVLGTSPGHYDVTTGEHVPGSKTNAAIVGSDINSANWKGGRASIKWLINEDWAITGIYNVTNSKIHGFNDYDPTIGDLKTVKFHKEHWNDDWHNFQFTIDGDLGFAKLTSSTSYFERNAGYVFDGTSGVAYYHSVLGAYGRGTCGSNPYYAAYNIYDFATACEKNGTGYDVDNGDPTGIWKDDQHDTRWTQETRLTGSTSRWDWTLGFFYQEAKQHWVYGTYIDNYTQTESWAAYNAIYGPLEPTNIRWASAERNKHKDVAVFGETTFSLTEKWKILAGARWYKADVDRYYTTNLPATAPQVASTSTGSDNGVLPKIGLQYFFEKNRMVYALFSEGFRPGGSNRARGTPTLPVVYKADKLYNYEAGLKSQWADGRLQFNLIGYHQVWKDMQLELVDPSYQFGEPWQTVVANVGEAVVDGMDLELTFMPVEGVTLGVVSTKLFKSEINKHIAVSDPRAPDNLALDIAKGTQLPLASQFKLAAYAEYNWQVNLFDGANAFVRLQYSHTGSSYNRLVDSDGNPTGTGYGGRTKQPGYSLWDLRAGISNTNWELSAYVDNFTDTRPVIFHDTNADLFWGRDNIRTSQPRTFGVNLRRYFH